MKKKHANHIWSCPLKKTDKGFLQKSCLLFSREQFVCLFTYLFLVLGIELWTLCLLNMYSASEINNQPKKHFWAVKREMQVVFSLD